MSLSAIGRAIGTFFEFFWDSIVFLVKGVGYLVELFSQGLPLINRVGTYLPPVAGYVLMAVMSFAVVKLVLSLLP